MIMPRPFELDIMTVTALATFGGQTGSVLILVPIRFNIFLYIFHLFNQKIHEGTSDTYHHNF